MTPHDAHTCPVYINIYFPRTDSVVIEEPRVGWLPPHNIDQVGGLIHHLLYKHTPVPEVLVEVLQHLGPVLTTLYQRTLQVVEVI